MYKRAYSQALGAVLVGLLDGLEGFVTEGRLCLLFIVAAPFRSRRHDWQMI
jgi:hypothetical protein